MTKGKWSHCGNLNHLKRPSHALQVTAPAPICPCPCQRRHLMSSPTTTKVRTTWLVWETEWRWGPWSPWRSPWGWMAGWFVKNRTRCWTWRLQWAPSCSQPSPCHWGSSWINMGRASYDCWAGKRRNFIQTNHDVVSGKTCNSSILWTQLYILHWEYVKRSMEQENASERFQLSLLWEVFDVSIHFSARVLDCPVYSLLTEPTNQMVSPPEESSIFETMHSSLVVVWLVS